jgi:hypothetical protein
MRAFEYRNTYEDRNTYEEISDSFKIYRTVF